jgi:hypothetical protein
MTRCLGAVACMCLAGGFAMSFYLGYLQWRVHPEYTRPQLFWAYWPLFGAAFVCFAGFVVAFNILTKPRRRA